MMRRSSRGYYYNGEGCLGAIIVCCIFLIVIGILFGQFVEWAWPYVKAWLHAVTA
jgi:hypothetical protein